MSRVVTAERGELDLSLDQRDLLLALALEDGLSAKDCARLDPKRELRKRLFPDHNGAEHADQVFRLDEESRQKVLRSAVRQGWLGEAVERCQTLFGPTSRAPMMQRILTGKLSPRPASGPVDAEVSRQLRLSLTRPFDPVWVEEVWGERSLSISLWVVEQAQARLADCQRLPHWLALKDYPAYLGADAARVLSTSGLLKNRRSEALELAELGTPHIRLTAGAIDALCQGNLGAARLLARRACSFPREGEPWSLLSPALVLCLLTSEEDEDQKLARKVLHRRDAGTLRPAFSLLRRIEKLRAPESPGEARLPLPKKTNADLWEWLLGGLIACAFVSHPWTRKAWQTALVERALSWSGAGYLWAGRQALLIAEELDAEATKNAVRGTAPELEPDLTRTPGDLAALPLGIPTWRRELSRLLTVGDVHAAHPRHRDRICWTVDMARGNLTRPAHEHFHPKKGFVQVERLELGELANKSLDLPPEDQRVVDSLRRAGQPEVEGLEALVGHPRVYSGLASGRQVEVTTGRFFVDAQVVANEVILQLDPKGLEPGLNVLRDGEARVEVIRVPEELAQVLDVLRDGLRVPKQHQGEALEALEALAGRLPIQTREPAPTQLSGADSTPCLRITKCFGAFLVELGVRPFGEGGRFFPAGAGPALLHGRKGGERKRAERDLEREQRRCQELTLQLSELTEERRTEPDQPSWLLGEEPLLVLISELGSAPSCTIEWNETSPYRLAGCASSEGLRVSIKPERGWYLASGRVPIDEVTALSLAELSHLPAIAKGRFVRLPSGEFLELDATLRRLLTAVRPGAADESTGVIRMSRAQYLGLTGERPPAWLQLPPEDDLMASLSRVRADRGDSPPEGLRAELRPYQQGGLNWMRTLASLGLGMCLADDMGLGKTVQVLALLLQRPKGSACLVIAPTSVCANWVREAERFAPSLRATSWESCRGKLPMPSPDGETSLLVASYAQLSQNQQLFAQPEWDTVIVDEAQFIKNARSERARACHSLSARVRIALTGTPIENHLGDLFSLFHFLNPGLLGDYRHFLTFFQKPIERENDKTALDLLSQLIKPFILRRTKTEVLPDLPPVTRVRREIELSREEALRYALLRKEIRERIKSKSRNNRVEILAEITRLRRFCCHPRLVFPTAEIESAKLAYLLELATELQDNGHQALIFSQYVDALELVRERFAEVELSCGVLDGSTPKAERQKRIDEFQRGGFSFFLISLKAGGFGINLTQASYVIHLDPWWNPAAMAQATDRAHRIGQDKPVVVYEFVTKDTIEGDVYRLHRKKRDLARSTLSSGAAGLELDPDDLERWLLEVALAERQ